MAAKRILQADGASLTAHCWQSGRVRVEAEFSNEPARIEALSGYLKKHRTSIFYLLADTAEEGFQLEDLPYVQGGDRNALLKRRLGQYFYNTPLSLSVSLGRAKRTGRGYEKILFAALTRAETFTPWLDALRDAEAILAGVYSVPLVLAQCGPQLLTTDNPVLLLTLSRGGVRQTFFDKKLHFSRLSQLATRSMTKSAGSAPTIRQRYSSILSPNASSLAAAPCARSFLPKRRRYPPCRAIVKAVRKSSSNMPTSAPKRANSS